MACHRSRTAAATDNPARGQPGLPGTVVHPARGDARPTTAPSPALNRALELIHTYAHARDWHRRPTTAWWLPDPDRQSLLGAASPGTRAG
ncbi:hypothetical protein GCM10010218_60040 [Streptomyces mashuensis]|uniref:Uncharacterized protein n=1 Tax=Streptomyces mashuensis TaxID=33904 RepID=A0A919EF78_9ACTN|nr:hypothetical protein GCM10010218_60040 [Streptomyces mashuensis]